MASTPVKSRASSLAGSPSSSPSQVLMQGDQMEGTSGLAKRVPRVRQGGDTGQYKKKVIERNCLVKIIDRLEDDRSMAPHVWNALDLNLITNVTDDEVANHQAAFFPEKVKSVKSLPDPWIASWLVAITNGRITSTMCDKLHGADTSALVSLLCFACMLCPTLTLPKEMLNKLFCSRVLIKRYAAVGNRLQNFEKCINEAGVINWVLACAFDFTWSGNSGDSRLASIRYKYGIPAQPAVVIPAHYNISSTAYTLVEPWLDWMGMFSDGAASSLKLCDFFNKKESKAPWRFPYDKACKFLQEDIKAVKEALAAEAAQASAGVHVAVELTTAAEGATNKRKATLQKAREALAKEQESNRGLTLRRTESLE